MGRTKRSARPADVEAVPALVRQTYLDLWMLSAALEAESDVDVTKEVA
jgi:hypothetical protein